MALCDRKDLNTGEHRVFFSKLRLNSVCSAVFLALILFNFISCKKQTEGFSVIEIADSSSGKIYGRKLIKDGNEFAIEFIHSVNNSAVHEIFKSEGKNIISIAVRFYSFGAGMQTELDEGLIMTRDGEAFVISGFNKTFKELNYIVGTVSDHLLITGDDCVSLRDMCGKNAHVTLRIR